MSVWGIHMGEHVGSAPVEEGYVAIGWPHMGDMNNLPADREAFKARLAETRSSAKSGAIAVWAGMLYRFVYEIQVGDIIVYPSKNDRIVNIGRCSGNYQHKEGDQDGYPNIRAVEWIVHVPRDEFPQAALNEIGSALTLFSIRRYADDFLERAGLARKPGAEEVEDDETATDEVSKQATETTADFIIRKLKHSLDPYEFEYFVAHIMKCMGYTARVTPASADGGVDVIAHKDELGFEPPIIKVQCKQITNQTSEPDVNQLLGTLGEGEFALFVNLGSYSKQARNLERNRAKLRLIDGEQMVDLVLEHYANLAPRYRTLIPLKQIYVPDL